MDKKVYGNLWKNISIKKIDKDLNENKIRRDIFEIISERANYIILLKFQKKKKQKNIIILLFIVNLYMIIDIKY